VKIRMNRRSVSRSLVSLLTTYAFVNSYLHGVHWAQKWSPDTNFYQRSAIGTAAIPELILISLAVRGKLDFKAYVLGSVSLSWTLWVNGASAVGSASGFVVALFPPVAALLLMWLETDAEPEEAQPVELAQVIVPAQAFTEPEPIVPAEPEPTPVEPVEAQAQAEATEPETEPEPPTAPAQAEPVEVSHLVIEPASAQNVTRLKPRPVVAQAQKRTGRGGSVVAQGEAWLKKESGGQSLTPAQIAEALGCSLASAKRIKSNVFGPVRANKTGKTDQERTA